MIAEGKPIQGLSSKRTSVTSQATVFNTGGSSSVGGVVTITGGTINGVTIGALSPGPIFATTLNASTAALGEYTFNANVLSLTIPTHDMLFQPPRALQITTPFPVLSTTTSQKLGLVAVGQLATVFMGYDQATSAFTLLDGVTSYNVLTGAVTGNPAPLRTSAVQLGGGASIYGSGPDIVLSPGSGGTVIGVTGGGTGLTSTRATIATGATQTVSYTYNLTYWTVTQGTGTFATLNVNAGPPTDGFITGMIIEVVASSCELRVVFASGLLVDPGTGSATTAKTAILFAPGMAGHFRWSTPDGRFLIERGDFVF